MFPLLPVVFSTVLTSSFAFHFLLVTTAFHLNPFLSLPVHCFLLRSLLLPLFTLALYLPHFLCARLIKATGSGRVEVWAWPTFVCNAAEALCTLDVPQSHRLVMGTGEQQRPVHGHRQTRDHVPKEEEEEGRGQISHTCSTHLGEGGLRSPVTFENLIPVAVRLERLVPTETLREKSRTVPVALHRQVEDRERKGAGPGLPGCTGTLGRCCRRPRRRTGSSRRGLW